MYRIAFVLSVLLAEFSSCQQKTMPDATTLDLETRLDTFRLYDVARQRVIPMAIYQPRRLARGLRPELIIFSHGYGQNHGGDYLQYTYLTTFLASKGYFVASIQHELPTDSLMPLTGIPQVVRRPFWERGADNILFTIREIQKSYPELDFQHITLIGHSNGGDMTALFPQKYPNMVDKIITLDNRRMALPRAQKPSVYSLRSSDLPADDGVLPSAEEQKALDITIIPLANTPHNDMDDDANETQRAEIRRYLLAFLKT